MCRSVGTIHQSLHGYCIKPGRIPVANSSYIVRATLLAGSIAPGFLTATTHADDFGSAARAYAQHDFGVAFPAFAALAKKGHSEAQNYLGLLYAKGQGVTRDDSIAAYWFREAARAGHEQAQRNLNAMLANGRARAIDADVPECR
jgi:TPR repeat protein